MTKIVVCGALFGLIPAFSQDTVLQMKMDLDKKMAEAKAIGFVSGQMISGKTVKGEPYSAQAVNETVQVLADGNRISHSSTSALYRDSEGRERREESMGVMIHGVQNEPAKAIMISDPVAGTSYSLDPNNKIAHKNVQQVKLMTRSDTVGAPAPPRAGAIVKSDQAIYTFSSGIGEGSNSFIFSSSSVEKGNLKKEDLGTQMIEGVSAIGTRMTTTIPAGQIGNDQPIVIVNERWVSPDLGVTVMSIHSDPRQGTTTYKLTNVSRSEPPHSLFEVPADYKVMELGTIRRDEER